MVGRQGEKEEGEEENRKRMMNTIIPVSGMTAGHQALYERALKMIPWATQTNAKRYDTDLMPARPPFIERAKGCRMWDMDNKEYIDFRCSLGPIILGYC